MLDQPDEIVIDAAADAGFDGVGLRVSPTMRSSDIETSRCTPRRQGLMVHDTEVLSHRRRMQPDPRPLIEQSAAIGRRPRCSSCPTCRTVRRPGGVDGTDGDDAEQHGVRVGLEYMAWTNPSAPVDAIDIADETGCVLLVDVLHHVRVGAGIDELDAIVESGRLGWVQLCDAPLASPAGSTLDSLIHEARHGRVPPGHGELPLRELLARLPADVTISVEVQSDTLLAMQPLARARLLHDASRSVLAG